jgi:hypothetical protein
MIGASAQNGTSMPNIYSYNGALTHASDTHTWNDQANTVNLMTLNSSGDVGAIRNVVATGTGTFSGISATNGLTMATNYVAANFVPTVGMVKIVASNRWLFTVTSVSTNPLVQINP